MKLSFDWLGEFVDLQGLTAEQVAEKLTMGAFEVEEVSLSGSQLCGPIVLGEVLEIHPHPNANKIRLTKTLVNAGEEPLDIVCGAANVEVGHRIAVALPGASVVNRTDGSKLDIKVSAIRGVTSNGMLCSAAELGIIDDSQGEGILILNDRAANLPLGADIQELLDLKTDYILHVEPRSNRGDAICVAGLAREVAALFNRPLLKPQWSLNEFKHDAEHGFNTWLENEGDCPFFSLRTIKGIKVGKSPSFIAKRLEAIGVRSVNNIVDITNYVMHELGQPLHAYDREKIKSNSLGVRRTRLGETLHTLDDRERALYPEVLVIADQENEQSEEATAVGLAGIMGGKDSEISDNTINIVLEAASFNQAVVRKGARTLGLSSDASLRFERGIDKVLTEYASNRAAYLIAKYCSNSQAQLEIGKLLTAGCNQAQEVIVPLRFHAIKRILGIELSSFRIKELLLPLGFAVAQEDEEKLAISVPSFRQADVSREIDLIEEVCRLNGYDQIPATMPSSTVACQSTDNFRDLTHQALIAQGLNEAWLSSLVSEGEPGIDKEREVRVLNPLSKDHQLLRQSLVPGLINTLTYNQDRGQKAAWLFEEGRVYEVAKPGNNNGKVKSGDPSDYGTGARERQLIAGAIMGERKGSSNNQSKAGKPDFYSTKGIVENLLEHVKVPLARIALRKTTDFYPWLHPHRSALVTLDRPAKPRPASQASAPSPYDILDENIVLGYIGEVHPRFRDSAGLKEDAFVFELDLDKLAAEVKSAKFKEIPNTPEVIRDLTCDFSENQGEIEQALVVKILEKIGGALLKTVELVSVYESERLSLSYRLTFQDARETLTANQVEDLVQAMRSTLTEKLKATFRA
jgi:phenylalanyl-tRNA synthetase beta chain